MPDAAQLAARCPCRTGQPPHTLAEHRTAHDTAWHPVQGYYDVDDVVAEHRDGEHDGDLAQPDCCPVCEAAAQPDDAPSPARRIVDDYRRAAAAESGARARLAAARTEAARDDARREAADAAYARYLVGERCRAYGHPGAVLHAALDAERRAAAAIGAALADEDPAALGEAVAVWQAATEAVGY